MKIINEDKNKSENTKSKSLGNLLKKNYKLLFLRKDQNDKGKELIKHGHTKTTITVRPGWIQGVFWLLCFVHIDQK